MWGRWSVMVGAAVLFSACSARSTKAPGVSPDFDEIVGRFRKRNAVAKAMERQEAPPEEAVRAPTGPTTLAPGESLWIQGGKSRVLEFPRPVTRVSIGNPDVAGVVVLGPHTVMINAKEQPKAPIESAPDTFTPQRSGVISGKTLTPEPHVEETTLVVWCGHGDPEVHDLLVADFLDRQVLLEVTVAELNRTAMEQHGIDFRQAGEDVVNAFFMGGGAGALAPGTVVTVPPQIAQPLLPLSPTDQAPIYAFQLPEEDITGFIQALQVEGLATVLAQPKLVAMSGQNAVFQVGGEIPIRIVSGFAADVEYKPFGTLVNFVPRVADDGAITLTVTPEVSQPDFTNQVEGVPTFRTRRASTSARLHDGQTLVIGGLLENDRQETVSGVPYLQDIPWLGYVFRKTSYTNNLTELLVVVTPRLVKPLAPGSQLALPTDRPPLAKDEVRTQPSPAEVTRPRVPGVP
ncbi:MAG TPA: pilus assembly protein N-terminal domain-containing protein [Candidatus Binatia bacterium]|nr:pilus assembly protein N-terminal domain-containing protein [Candidatus Binatia bacterium]